MILITGGAGYIGSHCALNFIENKIDDIIIFDNLKTGHLKTIETLKKISPKLKFIKGDLKNNDEIENVFKNNKIDCVIHFAAYSIVSKSNIDPGEYYENNVSGSINLFSTMVKYGVLNLVFSSSAAVYGEPLYTPIDERHPKNPINVYGRTKLMIEEILSDYDRAYGLKSVKLRYFNAAGADKYARIGEWHEIETHLIANIIKASIHNTPVKIFGNNYKTKDGTCIRDYIDVEDLAAAHALAYKYLKKGGSSDVFNLASQMGTSVFEIFNLISKISKKDIKYEICSKREGDPEILIANSKKAKEILGWEAKKTIEESIKCALSWHKKLEN